MAWTAPWPARANLSFLIRGAWVGERERGRDKTVSKDEQKKKTTTDKERTQKKKTP